MSVLWETNQRGAGEKEIVLEKMDKLKVWPHKICSLREVFDAIME
ncbi:MAG: hypothetical protein ACE5IT_00650 [bacterium]